MDQIRRLPLAQRQGSQGYIPEGNIDQKAAAEASKDEEDKENWRERTEIVTKYVHESYTNYASDLVREVVSVVPTLASQKQAMENKTKLGVDSDSEYESANELEDSSLVTPARHLSHRNDLFEDSLLSGFRKMKLDETLNDFIDAEQSEATKNEEVKLDAVQLNDVMMQVEGKIELERSKLDETVKHFIDAEQSEATENEEVKLDAVQLHDEMMQVEDKIELERSKLDETVKHFIDTEQSEATKNEEVKLDAVQLNDEMMQVECKTELEKRKLDDTKEYERESSSVGKQLVEYRMEYVKRCGIVEDTEDCRSEENENIMQSACRASTAEEEEINDSEESSNTDLISPLLSAETKQHSSIPHNLSDIVNKEEKTEENNVNNLTDVTDRIANVVVQAENKFMDICVEGDIEYEISETDLSSSADVTVTSASGNVSEANNDAQRMQKSTDILNLFVESMNINQSDVSVTVVRGTALPQRNLVICDQGAEAHEQNIGKLQLIEVDEQNSDVHILQSNTSTETSELNWLSSNEKSKNVVDSVGTQNILNDTDMKKLKSDTADTQNENILDVNQCKENVLVTQYLNNVNSEQRKGGKELEKELGEEEQGKQFSCVSVEGALTNAKQDSIVHEISDQNNKKEWSLDPNKHISQANNHSESGDNRVTPMEKLPAISGVVLLRTSQVTDCDQGKNGSQNIEGANEPNCELTLNASESDVNSQNVFDENAFIVLKSDSHESDEFCAVPCSKGYNLDILTDPNFNPFRTKATVNNSPVVSRNSDLLSLHSEEKLQLAMQQNSIFDGDEPEHYLKETKEMDIPEKISPKKISLFSYDESVYSEESKHNSRILETSVASSRSEVLAKQSICISSSSGVESPIISSKGYNLDFLDAIEDVTDVDPAIAQTTMCNSAIVQTNLVSNDGQFFGSSMDSCDHLKNEELSDIAGMSVNPSPDPTEDVPVFCSVDGSSDTLDKIGEPNLNLFDTQAIISNSPGLDRAWDYPGSNAAIRMSAIGSGGEISSPPNTTQSEGDSTMLSQITVIKKDSAHEIIANETITQELTNELSVIETINKSEEIKELGDPFVSHRQLENTPPNSVVDVSCSSDPFKTPVLPGKRRHALQRLGATFDASPIRNLANKSPAPVSTSVDELTLTSTREDFGNELSNILLKTSSEQLSGRRKVRQSMTSLEFDEITYNALALVNKVTPSSERRLTLSAQNTPGRDTFTDASQFFSNPLELDELAEHGTDSRDRLNLVRNSLYVKFDPLVGGRPSLAPLLMRSMSSVGESEEGENDESRRDTRLISFSPSPQKTVLSLLDTSQLEGPNSTVLASVTDSGCPRCSGDSATYVPETELRNLEMALQATHLRTVQEWEQKYAILTRQCTTQSRQLEEQSIACQEMQEHNDELSSTMKQLQVLVLKIVQHKEMLEKEHQDALQKQKDEFNAEILQLQKENAKLESTYFDHIQKFQRLREASVTLHNNEAKLRARNAELEATLNTKTEQVKQLLQVVDEKFKKAEASAEEERQRQAQEKQALTTLLKREALRSSSFQENVKLLQAQNKELQTLLDTLTAGAAAGLT